jgi:small-conductance mechanosensitive channel
MDLSKVSILAGAFGVGIGYGLQSVMNNFACGLILLFERPIHVGDTIVGANCASAPKRVIELLLDVVRFNPQALKYPWPQCLFVGCGDSSINFEMRAWTDQFDGYTKIRSGLNSAIYDAVPAAGISFPFPQREVRLLRDFGADSK